MRREGGHRQPATSPPAPPFQHIHQHQHHHTTTPHIPPPPPYHHSTTPLLPPPPPHRVPIHHPINHPHPPPHKTHNLPTHYPPTLQPTTPPPCPRPVRSPSSVLSMAPRLVVVSSLPLHATGGSLPHAPRSASLRSTLAFCQVRGVPSVSLALLVLRHR